MEVKLAEYRARKARESEKYRSDTNWKKILLSYIGFQNSNQNTSSSTIALSGNEIPIRNKDSQLRKRINSSKGLVQNEDSQIQDQFDGNHEHILRQDLPDQSQDIIQIPLTRHEKLFNVALIVLKIVLWVILWALFVEIGFGAVFFVLSSLFLIYRSMKTGSRDKSKLSAYSVFNPNFERLEGTFTAEQFEKELRYGAGSVR